MRLGSSPASAVRTDHQGQQIDETASTESHRSLSFHEIALCWLFWNVSGSLTVELSPSCPLPNRDNQND
jgi:hypothetical protein